MNERTQRWYHARIANADGEAEKAEAARDYLMAAIGGFLTVLDQPELSPTTRGMESAAMARELVTETRFVLADLRGEADEFLAAEEQGGGGA